MREGGGNVEDIIKKYLSKDEAKGLQNWDREEQKAITTKIRTKSGRIIEKVSHVADIPEEFHCFIAIVIRKSIINIIINL